MLKQIEKLFIMLALVTAFCVSGAPSVIAQTVASSDLATVEQSADDTDSADSDTLVLARTACRRAMLERAYFVATTFAWIVQPAFSHKEFRNAIPTRPTRPVTAIGDTVSAPLLI